MKYNVQLNVRIHPESGGYGGLEISETVNVSADGFLSLCQILGKFHELAQKIKEEEKK